MTKAPDPRFEPLTRDITPQLYAEIRDLWLLHVTNEEKLFTPHSEADGEKALATALTAFVDDCVMEMKQTGERWQGKLGARDFYARFLAAFENMQWTPQALVIGPQGVLDVADMTATQRAPFGGISETGSQVTLEWVIFFPWLTEQHKFRGETIYSIRKL